MIMIFFVYKQVNILHQNIDGLIGKLDELSIHIDELSNSGKQLDVICITEHNMIEDDYNILNLSNYKLASACSRKTRHGGVCILVNVKHSFKTLDVTQFVLHNILECCAIELTEHNIIIVCAYRVTQYTVSAYTLFFKKLNELLTTLCNSNKKKVILCGDFNIDMLTKTKTTDTLKHILQSYNLKIEINEPTRLASGTCLDNVFHNMRGCTSKVVELALSDHCAQILTCPVKKSYTFKHWYVVKRDYSEENVKKFEEYLKSISFNEVYASDDANEAFQKFYEIFQLLYLLCFPKIRVKFSTSLKHKWLSKGLKKCSRRKRELLWNYRRSHSKESKIKFKEYAKRFKAIIKLTQKSQNNYFINTSDNKCKATWNIINKSKSRNMKEYINKINDNGHILTDPRDISQSFNNYFINQISLTDINTNSNNSIKFNTNNNNSNSLFMKPTTPDEIFTIIKSLKNTKSTGYDEITTDIIKRVAPVIAPVLSHSINICINEGTYPDELKVSIIIPLFKKTDKENMNYYRPIALIPILSKIFEKVIYQRLNSYMEKYEMFSPMQMGFRKNKSINKAIYEFLMTVLNSMDKRIPVAALYMDLTKAFDYVNHDILLNKLDKYGVRGTAQNLIKSYLTNRTQKTQINRICTKSKTETAYFSDSKENRLGVPQGSVLGPLLFIIYINDLPQVTEHPMVLFADDSTVLFKDDKESNYENNINNTLTDIIHWLNNNKLLINLGKTKIMTFKQRINNKTIDIKYNDNKIEETEVTKFLGLYIDRNITWQAQTDHICSKLNTFSYALHNLSKVVSEGTVVTAYKGYVDSILRYGIIFWGNATNKDSVFKSQKRCIRAIGKITSTESCKQLFKKYKILTFPSLYILEMAIFVKLNFNSFGHFRSLRYGSKVSAPRHVTALYRKNIFGMAPTIFNKLPKAIRDAQDIQLFKTKLKNYLLDKIYYSVNEYLSDTQ